MGFPDPYSGCRRHPNQKQLPGVCSFCLRERLSKLSSANSSYRTANSAISHSSSSSSPPYSSASSFALETTVVADKEQTLQRPRHLRNGSDVAVPLGFVLHQGSGISQGGVNGGLGLKKSRSVACAPRIYRGDNGDGNGDDRRGKDGKGGKKGGVGLWKKLIRSTSKKTKGVLMHSMTMKERSRDDNSSSRKL